jgi:hypothetical protein
MSYHSEHLRMKPVLDLARQLDIANNPAPEAIFDPGSGGFQIWCTPEDHPAGWDDIAMNAGAFAKPCEYVVSVHWRWENDAIAALAIETTAYALADQMPNKYCDLRKIPASFMRRTIFNRDVDIAWAKEKVTWLFERANVPLLPFEYEPAPLSAQGPYLLAHYIGNAADYVVLVSPELDPEEFCQPGFQVAHTLEVWNADDFPADMPLIPAFSPVDPDERPVLKEPETASDAHADDWLEANFEDRISGCGE